MSFLRSFVSVPPAPGSWRVASRAGLTVFIALTVLWSTGHVTWSIFGAFGGFASVFGRTVPLPQRLRMQAEAGSSIVLALLIGVCVGISPDRAWLVIPVAAAYTTASAIISHRRGWHPPGALFQVFAMGAGASTPHTATDLVPAACVSVATLLFAMALTYVYALVRHLRRRRLDADSRMSAMWRSGPRPAVGPEWPIRHYLIRYGLAVVVAGGLATAIGIGHPYWAMVSAVVPMAAPNALLRAVRGVHRLVGTLLGVCLIWLIFAAGPSSFVLIVLAAVFQVLAELFIGRNYGIAMLFVTPLALGMVQLAHPLPVGPLISDRAAETLLGVLVALVITVLTRERMQPGDIE